MAPRTDGALSKAVPDSPLLRKNSPPRPNLKLQKNCRDPTSSFKSCPATTSSFKISPRVTHSFKKNCHVPPASKKVAPNKPQAAEEAASSVAPASSSVVPAIVNEDPPEVRCPSIENAMFILQSEGMEALAWTLFSQIRWLEATYWRSADTTDQLVPTTNSLTDEMHVLTPIPFLGLLGRCSPTRSPDIAFFSLNPNRWYVGTIIG